MTVTFKGGPALDLPRAFELINAGGFRARKEETVLTLSGTLARDGERLYLLADRMKAPLKFELLELKEVPRFLTGEVTVETMGPLWVRLRELAGTTDLIVIEGLHQAEAGAAPSLRVLRLNPKP